LCTAMPSLRRLRTRSCLCGTKWYPNFTFRISIPVATLHFIFCLYYETWLNGVRGFAYVLQSLAEVEQKWKIAKNVQEFQKELTGKIECIIDRLPNLKESEVIRTLGKNFEEKLADSKRLAMLLKQNYDEKLADSQIIIADQISNITELKGRLAMLALLDENELKQVREMHNEDRTLLAKQDLEIKLLKERLNEAETKTEVRRVSAGREMTREVNVRPVVAKQTLDKW